MSNSKKKLNIYVVITYKSRIWNVDCVPAWHSNHTVEKVECRMSWRHSKFEKVRKLKKAKIDVRCRDDIHIAKVAVLPARQSWKMVEGHMSWRLSNRDSRMFCCHGIQNHQVKKSHMLNVMTTFTMQMSNVVPAATFKSGCNHGHIQTDRY